MLNQCGWKVVANPVSLWIALCIFCSPLAGAEWRVTKVGQNAAETKIENALDEAVRLEFIDTPLADVVDFLSDLTAIQIVVEEHALEDLGIGTDTPITADLEDLSLRSALKHVLRELNLDFVVRDEVLVITTYEVARTEQDVRLYNVKPLLGDDADAGKIAQTVGAILYSQSIGGGSSGATGGGGGIFNVLDQFGSSPSGHAAGGRFVMGTIIPYRHLLIVRETKDNHRTIALLLESLESALVDKQAQE